MRPADITEPDIGAMCDDADDLLYAAWGIIANSGLFGNPSTPTPGADTAAIIWRDRYHAYLSLRHPILNNGGSPDAPEIQEEP